MAKKTKKVAKVVDVKRAAANDKPDAPAPKEVVIRKGDSAVGKGAKYAVMAGRPSKQAVTAVFGSRGYALSGVARAEKMNTTPEALCARFAAEPQGSESGLGVGTSNQGWERSDYRIQIARGISQFQRSN